MALRSEHFDVQMGSSGIVAGTKLLTAIFVPNNVGIVWTDANGNFWLESLMTNVDGTVSKQLQQVTI